jgi:hypothetical protein
VSKIHTFNTPENKKKVKDLLEKANQPISIDWLAYQLNVGWGTARAILLDMVLEGQIASLKTSKGLLFAASQSSIKLNFGVNLNSKPPET